LTDQIYQALAHGYSRGQVVVGCYKGKIYFHDISTGKLSWTVQTDGEVQMLHLFI
jgi:outer membrane protein assembly factor BamB